MKSKISSLKKKVALMLAVVLVMPIRTVQASTVLQPEVASLRGEYEILLNLDRLPVVANIMFAGAHPDDENNANLVYFHDKYLADTTYVDSNWGEGGDNAMGGELYGALGVVRSQELLSARMFDNAKQLYLGMYDFGYSTSIEESILNLTTGEKGIFDPNIYTYNYVKLIRTERPDVIASNHRYLNNDHGQHQAMGYINVAAINAAADPNYIVKDKDGNNLEPWTVKRYFNTWKATSKSGVWDGEATDADLVTDASQPDPYLGEDHVSVDFDGNNPETLTKHTYSQWGGEGRSYHRTQKMSRNTSATAGVSNWKLFKSASGYDSTTLLNSPNRNTMFAGMDTSILRINKTLDDANKKATQGDVNALKKAVDLIVSNFNRDIETINTQPNAVHENLKLATTKLVALEAHAKKIKDGTAGKQDFTRYLEMIREHITKFTTNLYGISLNIVSNDTGPVPGQTINVTSKILVREDMFDKIVFPKASSVINVDKGISYASKTPKEITDKGTVNGKDNVKLKGYEYVYVVNIPKDYKEYTGPYNAPYNEAYTNANYPNGLSLHNKLDWANTTKYEINDSSKFEDGKIGTEPNPKSVEDTIKPGITIDGLQPYSVPFVVGLADIKVNGQIITIEKNPDLRLIPEISVQVENKNMMFRYSGEQIVGDLNLVVKSGVHGVSKVDLSAISSVKGVTVSSGNVVLSGKGDTKTAKLNVTIPSDFKGSFDVNVNARYDSKDFKEGYTQISYPHIRTQNYYTEAVQKVTVAEYGLPDDNIKIGFVATGMDDDVFNYIKGMYSSTEKANINLTKLGSSDIAKNGEQLKRLYDTIVVGKTAFESANVSLGMRASYSNLLDFANLGGNLVVHYQNFQGTSEADKTGYTWNEQLVGKMPLAPVPFMLSGANINDENSDVFVTSIDSDLYNRPNKIDLTIGENNKSGSDIWNGWIQQRCEWTPGDSSLTGKDAQLDYVKNLGYDVLFYGHDPDGMERPAVLYKDMNNGGHYTYSAVVWDRQLIGLVPGAYKLYANMLSLGYK